MHSNKIVAVVGAGTMGSGIAQVFAQSGYLVKLTDVDQKVLERALEGISGRLQRSLAKGTISPAAKVETLVRIDLETNLAAAVAQAGLVIEAVSEDLDIKSGICRQLSASASYDAILASNTSSISITKLAALVAHPDRFIGMHFMNPVPVMPLIEIIRGLQTSDHTVASVIEVGKSLGKTPIEVQDYPGFVSNRILMPMINEAVYTLYEGVATKEAIDAVMKLGMNHPMGPLELADLIGLDVCLSILQVLHQGFGNPKYAPCPLLANLVASGQLGRKTGKGFYTYSKP